MRLRVESLRAEEVNRQLGFAVDRHVCEGGTENAGELETVSRQPSREDHTLVVRVAIDEKLSVGRHRIETDGVSSWQCVQSWQGFADKLDHRL